MEDSNLLQKENSNLLQKENIRGLIETLSNFQAEQNVNNAAYALLERRSVAFENFKAAVSSSPTRDIRDGTDSSMLKIREESGPDERNEIDILLKRIDRRDETIKFLRRQLAVEGASQKNDTLRNESRNRIREQEQDDVNLSIQLEEQCEKLEKIIIIKDEEINSLKFRNATEIRKNQLNIDKYEQFSFQSNERIRTLEYEKKSSAVVLASRERIIERQQQEISALEEKFAEETRINNSLIAKMDEVRKQLEEEKQVSIDLKSQQEGLNLDIVYLRNENDKIAKSANQQNELYCELQKKYDEVWKRLDSLPVVSQFGQAEVSDGSVHSTKTKRKSKVILKKNSKKPGNSRSTKPSELLNKNIESDSDNSEDGPVESLSQRPNSAGKYNPSLVFLRKTKLKLDASHTINANNIDQPIESNNILSSPISFRPKSAASAFASTLFEATSSNTIVQAILRPEKIDSKETKKTPSPVKSNNARGSNRQAKVVTNTLANATSSSPSRDTDLFSKQKYASSKSSAYKSDATINSDQSSADPVIQKDVLAEFTSIDISSQPNNISSNIPKAENISGASVEVNMPPNIKTARTSINKSQTRTNRKNGNSEDFENPENIIELQREVSELKKKLEIAEDSCKRAEKNRQAEEKFFTSQVVGLKSANEELVDQISEIEIRSRKELNEVILNRDELLRTLSFLSEQITSSPYYEKPHTSGEAVSSIDEFLPSKLIYASESDIKLREIIKNDILEGSEKDCSIVSGKLYSNNFIMPGAENIDILCENILMPDHKALAKSYDYKGCDTITDFQSVETQTITTTIDKGILAKPDVLSTYSQYEQSNTRDSASQTLSGIRKINDAAPTDSEEEFLIFSFDLLVQICNALSAEYELLSEMSPIEKIACFINSFFDFRNDLAGEISHHDIWNTKNSRTFIRCIDLVLLLAFQTIKDDLSKLNVCRNEKALTEHPIINVQLEKTETFEIKSEIAEISRVNDLKSLYAGARRGILAKQGSISFQGSLPMIPHKKIGSSSSMEKSKTVGKESSGIHYLADINRIYDFVGAIQNLPLHSVSPNENAATANPDINYKTERDNLSPIPVQKSIEISMYSTAALAESLHISAHYPGGTYNNLIVPESPMQVVPGDQNHLINRPKSENGATRIKKPILRPFSSPEKTRNNELNHNYSEYRENSEVEIVTVPVTPSKSAKSHQFTSPRTSKIVSALKSETIVNFKEKERKVTFDDTEEIHSKFKNDFATHISTIEEESKSTKRINGSIVADNVQANMYQSNIRPFAPVGGTLSASIVQKMRYSSPGLGSSSEDVMIVGSKTSRF